MSFENAELTKIALNSFVTTKITFANMLSELCENIPGGDVDVNNDGAVDVADLVLVALSYGSTCCIQPDWCSGADVNHDGVVDINDMLLIGPSFD